MIRPRLSRSLILDPSLRKSGILSPPPAQLLDLPEKVIQFGSGRFLRAFVEDFIDRANRRGAFNGRIVVVQSTSSQRADTLDEQDGLYTLCVRGLKRGERVEEFRILSPVSRALAAAQSWNQILECARNPNLELIVSNTTEVGIQLDSGDAPDLNPPRSFPGKLTALLHERYKTFQGADDKGLVIIPCELIENNADRLREIVRELGRRWGFGESFLEWIRTVNHFCNSLVDRIVTGNPSPEERERVWDRLGYEDQLLTVAEVYSLWAIQGDESLRRRLHFPDTSPSVIVAEDITPYRERKLRILNGTHTVTAPLSFLLGNNTILETMQGPLTARFVERVMREEIGPTLDLRQDVVRSYIEEVLERFRNPYLEHKLLDITFQSTLKMRVRLVPIIKRYCQHRGQPPPLLSLGFAFYLFFMRGAEEREGKILGRRGQELYPINDDQAPYLFSRWRRCQGPDERQAGEFVRDVCRNEDLWGMNLDELPGFTHCVAKNLSKISSALARLQTKGGDDLLRDWIGDG